MRPRISSFTFPWAVGIAGGPVPPTPLNALELLERAAGPGVAVLQIGDNVPLDRMAARELDVLRQRADTVGVQLEVGARGLQPHTLSRYLAVAHRLESPLLRVVVDAPGYEPDESGIVAILAEALPAFEAAGVALAVEKHDRFPETFVMVECANRSVELGPDYWVRVTVRGAGTWSRRCPPPYYEWAEPRYALVHASIVPCCQDLLRALQTGAPAETSGQDNLATMRLVFATYQSAASGRAVLLRRGTS